MTKIQTPEQFAAVAQANVDTLNALTQSVAAHAERLAALNLDTARSVLEDSTAGARNLMTLQSPQDLLSLQARMAQPIVEKAVAYVRGVSEIVSEGQQEMVDLFESQLAELNRNFAALLDQAASSAPAGTESFFSAVRTAVQSANSAYENFSKAARQAAQTAEANVSAATEATVKAVTGSKPGKK